MKVVLNCFNKKGPKVSPFKLRVRGFQSMVADKNDSRIFLYKMPNHKWMGVTLNFAHSKAWWILFWTMLPMMLLVCSVILAKAWINPDYMVIYWAAFITVCASYLIGTTVYYFRMAARDDQLSPINDDKHE